ncbi:hypothetical protein [Rhizobium sp. R635]|uniref:hypothetical protein n=1 Tax=Rhizobium sp. R635 TaxID=1764275 RepID=UPI000B5373A6|nr:hypothetical protein [Rhizobium sp. R635]
MDRSPHGAPVTSACSGLGFADRQIVLRQIVDDLRNLREGVPDDAFDQYQALDRLLPMISASIIPISRADDEYWENILMELLDLRAAMIRLRTGAAETSH